MSLSTGTAVAADPRAFTGAEPMTKYLVVGTHKDKSVDLALAANPRVVIAERVNTKHLVVLK